MADDLLLTTSEVAALFRVTSKQILRWVKAGRITPVEYPGGHLRFRESEIRALINPPKDPA